MIFNVEVRRCLCAPIADAPLVARRSPSNYYERFLRVGGGWGGFGEGAHLATSDLRQVAELVRQSLGESDDFVIHYEEGAVAHVVWANENPSATVGDAELFIVPAIRSNEYGWYISSWTSGTGPMPSVLYLRQSNIWTPSIDHRVPGEGLYASREDARETMIRAGYLDPDGELYRRIVGRLADNDSSPPPDESKYMTTVPPDNRGGFLE